MINIIVAMDKNNGIGKDNKLLAHIPEDLSFFKGMTQGNTVVMGYNTYISLPKRPLPNRKNIVITTKDIKLNGAEVVHSIEELLSIISLEEEVFICGGESIYKQMLPYADRLYITHIFHEFESDTFFPTIVEDWKIVASSCEVKNIYNKYPHIFTVYHRKKY